MPFFTKLELYIMYKYIYKTLCPMTKEVPSSLPKGHIHSKIDLVDIISAYLDSSTNQDTFELQS
jgi:hypothetical protein